MEYIPENNITKEEELIDLIYKKKPYIFDYYSIYDLINLIRYSKNDITKIYYLLDNYSKEENFEIIENSKLIDSNKISNNIKNEKK